MYIMMRRSPTMRFLGLTLTLSGLSLFVLPPSASAANRKAQEAKRSASVNRDAPALARSIDQALDARLLLLRIKSQPVVLRRRGLDRCHVRLLA